MSKIFADKMADEIKEQLDYMQELVDELKGLELNPSEFDDIRKFYAQEYRRSELLQSLGYASVELTNSVVKTYDFLNK